MAHTGAVYMVRVHRYRHKAESDYQKFGALEENGKKRVITVLKGYLDELAYSSDDDLKDVSGARVSINGDDLRAVLIQGQRGQAAKIRDPGGAEKGTVLPEDTSEVVCGALFRLPPKETTGWLCCHNNFGRGIKTLMVGALASRFAEEFPDLRLEVRPAPIGKAVAAAVERDDVLAVRLHRVDRGSDIANPSATQWVRGNQEARVTLEIAGIRGSRLYNNLILRHLRGDSQAFGQIVTFDGLEFESATVSVQLEHGPRTFNIDNPSGGFAIT